MNQPTVFILLAAHNGEAYLLQLLESLSKQDYPHIKVVLSDDSSTDSTALILAEFAAQHPEQFQIHHRGLQFHCPQKHFMHLLSAYQDKPYLMFCDQDDVWHPDKVSKTLRQMTALTDDSSVPCLVHTDLRVVDANLNVLSQSFCRSSGLDGHRMAFNHLLVQNVVTGCTTMVNSALAKLACSVPYPEEMLMHDWWLALLASSCGITAFITDSTIDYRQHGANSVGAKNTKSLRYLIRRLCSAPMRHAINRAVTQAQGFRRCYLTYLTADHQLILNKFISTGHSGLLKRDYLFIRYGLLKSGIMRKIAQLLGL